MIRVNFLSPEYRQKIFLRKFATFAAFVVTALVALILVGGAVLNSQINTKTAERDRIQNDIVAIKAKAEEIKNATASIEDLSSKIQIIDDILNQKKYGFSEVLYRLKETVPARVWLNTLTYDGQTIVLKGFANSNERKGLTAGQNYLSFERNLRESPSYDSIDSEYARTVEQNGEELREFKLTITLVNE